MRNSQHLWFLMNHIFLGFGLSVGFGAMSAAAVWFFDGKLAFDTYLTAFFVHFNCAISGGLIASAAYLVYRSQDWVPDLIEKTYGKDKLKESEFPEQRKRYYSLRRSIEFSAEFIVIGFFIFYFAGFPLETLPEALMIAFACIQYALGVYVGRKIFYIAHMLNAIEVVEIEHDVFSGDKLGLISTYVNTISTFTVIFVFVIVLSHYRGPFEYDSFLGESVKLLLLVPAFIAAPVVAIFNFYPRSVLKTIYTNSINRQTERIKEQLKNEELSEFERMTYLIEYDKMSKEELKYRLRITLSDLPIAITIIFMILGVILN